MEKFDLLINVLRDLQTAGILRHVVLVGSWCQNFYRHIYGNPVEIPVARTLDAGDASKSLSRDSAVYY